jgi:hypothetical protein
MLRNRLVKKGQRGRDRLKSVKTLKSSFLD